MLKKNITLLNNARTKIAKTWAFTAFKIPACPLQFLLVRTPENEFNASNVTDQKQMSVATLTSDSKPKKQASTQKPEGAADFALTAFASEPIHVRWIESIEELESMKAQWNELANQSLHRNPTFESNFLIPALKHLANHEVKILVAEVHSEFETHLVGLIPLAAKKVMGLPLPSLEIWKHEQSFDCTPLIRAELAEQVWTRFVAFLQQEKISFFSMESVSAESEFAALINQTESDLNLKVFRKNEFARAAIRPHGTAEEYKQNHFSKNLRKSIRRQLKKLQAAGTLTFEKSSPDSDFESLANEFLSVEASGWKGQNATALLSHESTRDFYHELIQRSVSEGKARFLVMRLDGKPISILSDLQSGNAVFSYKTAFDENYSEFSPGIQAEIQNIENLFADNIEFADSCTATDNSAINRVWAEKEKFQNLVIALKPGIASLLVRWMPTLQAIVRKLRRQ